MTIEDIVYQAYLLILSWPTQDEIANSSNAANTNIDNATEPDML